jgi:hypothetical protein
VYALARFGANILMMPAKGMELPAHVDWRLRNEFHCTAVPRQNFASEDASIDAVYTTAEEPHQLSLYAPDENLASKLTQNIDALYMTRFQKERWTEGAPDYPKVDAKYLGAERFKRASVLHPLPRVGELDVSFDQDIRAAYFRQAAYGVPIRMALIAVLMGSDQNTSLEHFESGFRLTEHVYEQPRELGLLCTNPNCITRDPLDAVNATPKFLLIPASPPRLRCFYCECDRLDFVSGSKNRPYDRADEICPGPAEETLAFFADESAAEAHGYRRSRTLSSGAAPP